MPLVLALKTGEGFRSGQFRAVVEKTISPTEVRLRLGDGRMIKIDDRRPTEIAPNVSVMCGHRGQGNLARLVIDADRAMKISRDQPVRSAQSLESTR